jgi:hypothetical protein
MDLALTISEWVSRGSGTRAQRGYSSSWRRQEKGVEMESASPGNAQVERKIWSLAFARGYTDGTSFRSAGKRLSHQALIGIDEYCNGFRAGYFERSSASSRGAERP